MKSLSDLLENNKVWAEKIEQTSPGFFEQLSAQQTPEILWIGCSDSRVPANQIVGLLPGDVFVHRNVANIVNQTDLNCLSVIQYAVEVLKVKHIVVVGHYGCGGVKTALHNERNGLIDNWLRNIKDTYASYQAELEGITDESQRVDRLCELNVMQQVMNVSQTTVVQEAWSKGQNLTVHGWVYSIKNGLITNLDVSIQNNEATNTIYKIS
ncbi:carbonate dehydratase [Alkalimarinus coralli]|uniref:carbonate dehydratase n=1 Tax=Alkalimarinus coralli TaxID=2935863 RepID=UPI00202B9027|nr:carbonate dehydratase [Alkalimarinus coralli]